MANPLTADEATARARWLVEQRYGVAAVDLAVVGIAESFDPSAFEIQLQLHRERVSYTVTVEESDGLAAFSRIVMSQDND